MLLRGVTRASITRVQRSKVKEPRRTGKKVFSRNRAWKICPLSSGYAKSTQDRVIKS